MKISEAKRELKNSFFNFVEIRKNPGNISEYIVLLYGHNGKSFMLAYENNSVLSSPQLEHIVLTLKEIGFKKARIYF